MENFRRNKWMVSGIIILSVLNFAAFYILKKGIEISDALEHPANDAVETSLRQKMIFTNIFPSIISNLDIACILLMLYLFIKFVIKNMKTTKIAQKHYRI